MIAKHTPIRSLKKSDFKNLVDYISDDQNKNERVGEITITNCESSTLKASVNEVQATQQLNTRAKSDKTYHLLISFPPGEKPINKILKNIESQICKGLGFKDHQRISAVHHDTDNLHIHIAINKIHPKKLTIHEPYYSHRKLGELCTGLEKKYNLQVVNHISNQRGGAARANDMEHHSGIESLAGWIKRECLDDINNSESWGELHQVMNDNGLLMIKQGNGLVVKSDEGVVIKASTLSRMCSKPNLEKKLGIYIASELYKVKPIKEYKKKPIELKINTDNLYVNYLNERGNSNVVRGELLDKLKHNKAEQLSILKLAGRVKRALINHSGNYVIKKLLYSQDKKKRMISIQNINKRYHIDKDKIHKKYKYVTWADWLRQQALKGNSEALDALRARPSKTELVGSALKGSALESIKPLNVDNITKKGTVIYRDGPMCGVRDDGKQLLMPKKPNIDCLLASLKLAQQKYGTTISVNGSDQFKTLIINTVLESGMPIKFTDLKMEQERAFLLKEKNDGRQNDRRKSHSRSDGGVRQGRFTHSNRERRAQRGGPDEPQPKPKPNIRCVGHLPPPSNRHRLRSLSQLGMVRITSGSEMLLSGDVPRNVEQQRTQPDHSLRWGVGGARLSAAQAVHKYINERELKRQKGIDIVKHVHYQSLVKGNIYFAGMRNVESQLIVLLTGQGEKEIMVLAVPKSSAQHLKHLKLGESVKVNKAGQLERTRKIRR